MKSNTKKLLGVILLAAAVGVSLYFRKSGLKISESGNRFVMGTVARVVAVSDNEGLNAAAIEMAFGELERVEGLMSDYDEDSEIGRLNRYGHERGVEVSEDVFEVLEQAVEFGELSGGAFDVTVGPVVDLWREAEDANELPSADEIEEARAKVGYEKLVLDEERSEARFKVKGMRVDAGGIAKGYGIDKAIEALKRSGCVGGMVDVGGDISVFGKPGRGREEWVIGLQDPGDGDRVEEGKLVLVLKMREGAIATSGGYRRFVMVEGERQSHIVDTRTGEGSEKFSSVSVIAAEALKADALATAVSVLGREKGLELIEGAEGVEAVIITNEGEILETSGAGKYLDGGGQ